MKCISQLPIGVFDSGVGGLTVLNALRETLPNENLLYLGDTARVPYGTKSSASVTRYADQAVKALREREVKFVVIACNTASAVAVEPLACQYPEMPIVGVVGPGADASCGVSQSGRIGVIATESTVNNQAYQSAILQRRPDATIKALACSLFVALAEEGWHDGELVEQVVARCLEPIREGKHANIDTLVLGCTHFPVLKRAISKVMGERVHLVDSAETTALVVKKLLREHALGNSSAMQGDVSFLVTDSPERFVRVARNFFTETIESGAVELIDIQHFQKI
ncbi:glutamate racemase [Pontibacterium sp.]|uniref:glutamate racemase n=1 Tax=Pontibacterium sp. TaxID=2036026 RepID=UPI003565024C